MAYRPTNNIKENVIHRNTIFDAQGMVSCCSCGYCIEKNEDATLTLTNFKAADPLINENLIASTILEFSDYMIPNGSFEYSLTPYKYPFSQSILDESVLTDNKFSTGLAYYPFLRCDGVTSTPLYIPPYSSIPSLNPIKNNIQYGSSFYYLGYGDNNLFWAGYITPNPALIDNNASMSFINISPSYSQDAIYYDQSGFGSFAYSPSSFGYSYNNTDITLTYFSPSICFSAFPSDLLSFTTCPKQSDFYKWGVSSPYTAQFFYYNYYLSIDQVSWTLKYGFYHFGGSYYIRDILFPRITNLDFSNELSYNLLSILQFGPTQNFVSQTDILRYNFFTNNPAFYDTKYFLPLSDFQSSANGSTYLYTYNAETNLNESRLIWYEPNPNNTEIPKVPPCTHQELLDNIYSRIPVSNPDIESFLIPKTIPLSKANIGSAQNYFNYIDSHEYSQKGFKADSGCANGIVKVMQPVFFADFDNHVFSFVYPDYTSNKKSFYITDKFIVPDRTSWSDCQATYNRETLESPWVFQDIVSVPAKTVKFNEMNSLVNVYKKGYVLDRFQLGDDGSFLATLSIIKESPFYSFGVEAKYKIEQQTGHSLYTGIAPTNRCAYTESVITDTVGRYWGAYASPMNYSSPLLYKGNFISDVVPLSFYEYVDQELIASYTNGFFVGHNNVAPFVYYEDYCQGFMGRSPINSLYQYVAQKTERTRITSKTDSSGWTTMLMENVLWVGKTLLTETYANLNSPQVLAGGVTKIVPSSNPTYSSIPVISISGPTGPNKIQATAVPIMNGQVLTGIQITNSGSGYISIPSVNITPNIGISFYVEIEDNRDFLANGQRIPETYDAILKGGFESDIEVGFQSVPICKSKNIIDRMKRVSNVKVNFLNYEKIPQLNTLIYDYQQLFIDATPETPDGYFSNYASYDFNNIAFAPPTINPSNLIFLKIKDDSYSIIKQMEEIDPPVLTSYVAKPGRAYPDFGVADRFKSCLLINGDPDVWKTGNEVQFVGLDYLVTNGGSGYTSVPTVTLSNGGGTGATAKATISNGMVIAVTVVNKGKDYTSNKTVVISGGGGNGATAVDISFTPFYSIYMEEIKDEKQTAGQTLIRIAKTLQDANNGVYIPNVGLETLYKDKSLSVKFLYGWKDATYENTPQYEENFDPNELDFSNFNANKLNASAIEVGEFPLNTNGLIGINSGFFPFPNFYWPNISFSSYDRFEIVSLSPLKIKYIGARFISLNSLNLLRKYTISGLVTPDNVNIPNFSSLRQYGFMCDIVVEEVVDEFIQEALPVEFNQILQNVEFIQTSNLMNSRTPMQMINPEQCEHIGKVIDRKDCNCPKKWVRLCDVHGKTDWKKCMQCKDFKVSE